LAVLGPGVYPWVGAVGIQNDDMSSLQPTDEPPTREPRIIATHTVLFEHAQFHGAHKHVFAAEGNLNAREDNFFNDRVSSIYVAQGIWEFFRDANFSNAYRPALGPGAYPWVANVGIANDDLSSLRPV